MMKPETNSYIGKNDRDEPTNMEMLLYNAHKKQLTIKGALSKMDLTRCTESDREVKEG